MASMVIQPIPGRTPKPRHSGLKASYLLTFLRRRVMAFGYNANGAFDNTTADIVDHAKDMLSSLIDNANKMTRAKDR